MIHRHLRHTIERTIIYSWFMASMLVVMWCGFRAIDEYSNWNAEQHSIGFYAVNQFDELMNLARRFVDASEKNFGGNK